ALKQGAQVVVGTPGRILDHIRRGTLNLSELRFIVLDEADEMLRMGFIDDVETVMAELPENHQTALFSAT
ncbi:DEAD/DEAH box helicase, partial [Streptococcus pneumoniae]